MKRTYFVISMFVLVANLFLSNGFAQDYVHYATLVGHTGSVRSVAYSPDGSTLASGSGDSTIRLWDAHTRKLKNILAVDSEDFEIDSVAYSPDGHILASGAYNGTIRLWDVRRGELLHNLTGHQASIRALSFNTDSRTLASASDDQMIRLWEAHTGKHLYTLTGHHGTVTSIAYSSNGLFLASGAFDESKIRLWTLTGQLIKTLGTSELLRGVGPWENGVMSIAYSPDGRTLANGTFDGTIRLWDVHTGKLLYILTGHTFSVRSVAYSPDGHTLASGGWDSKVKLWNTVLGQHKDTLAGHTSVVSSVAFSPDGRTLASGSYDKTIRLWRISPPKLSADQIYNNAIRAVMWIVNPDIGKGSGVLIDKQFKLAITNAHVAGTQNTIDVYFPAPDENGELIKDRNFYLTSSGVLKRLGYYTKGRVVAKNEETDLAIIKLDGLPETAHEVDWNFNTPTTNTGDMVYILGNPGGQDLWRWTLGEFLKDHEDFLHIQSDVFGGNSGGPVLNKQGILIGIVARSDRHMNALAIPVRYISRLLSESRLEHSRSRR